MHARAVCIGWAHRESGVAKASRSVVYIHEIEAVLVYALLLGPEWVLIEEKREWLPRANYLFPTLLYHNSAYSI